MNRLNKRFTLINRKNRTVMNIGKIKGSYTATNCILPAHPSVEIIRVVYYEDKGFRKFK